MLSTLALVYPVSDAKPVQNARNAGNAPSLSQALFINPPHSVRPLYRWWLPLGATDDAELRLELEQMSLAGAGGVEVDPMPVPGPLGLSGPFLAKYGWGSAEWTRTLQTVYSHAPRLGLGVDMLVSPMYPIALPTNRGMNDPSLGQQLIFGAEQLQAGASRTGLLPMASQAAPSVSAQICAPALKGDNALAVGSTVGFAPGDVVRVGPAGSGPTTTIRSISPSLTAACTPLLLPASAGSTEIFVADSLGNLLPGADITVGYGDEKEAATIASVTAEKKGSRITLARALRRAVTAGTIVSRTPAKMVLDKALASDSLPTDVVTNEARTTLVAVVAAECASTDCPSTGGKRILDPASAIDLTRQVGSGGELTWTAPAGKAPWWLIAFYQTADGQTVAGLTPSSPDYVIDYIGRQGMDALNRFYHDAILTPALSGKIRKSGGALFEDSYEPSNTVKWTWNFLGEFEKRRGYSLTPYLPVLAGGGMGAQQGYFELAGVSDRIREDYRQTWSDLYRDNHLKPFHAMAHGLGLKSRVQIEGGPMEVADLARIVDIPEGENRNFLNNTELFKVIAVGAQLRDIEGVVSSECCPIAGGTWATTMGGPPFTISQGTGASFGGAGNNANLNWVYKAFLGGVNQLVWHGFPYKETPKGTGERSVWPGNTFDGNTQFSEAFGPRMPQWQDLAHVNDHLARLQLILRQGRPQYDVAIFWHDFGVKGIAPNVTPYTGYPGLSNMLSTTSRLAGAGFTYQYVSPAYMSDLAGQGATPGNWKSLGFKVLVVNRQSVMPATSLKNVLRLTTSRRVPVIFVGTRPGRSPGLANKNTDTDVHRLMREFDGLAKQPGPTVFFVENDTDLASLLERLSIKPAAAHLSDPDSSAIISLRRRARGTDYYVLFNQGTTRVSQTISLEGNGRPLELRTWSGEMVPLGMFKAANGRVDVPVEIGPNDIKVIALGNDVAASAAMAAHAVSTDGGEVLSSAKGLVLRTQKPGNFSTLLADGHRVDSEVPPFKESVTPDHWTVTVESWLPDGTGEAGVEHTKRVSTSAIPVMRHQDGTLSDWAELGLADVAGLGVYRASFDFPGQPGTGAYLDLGKVVDTFQVSMNGKLIAGLNYQDPSKIDVGPYLRAGKNELEVRVATPLRNAVVKATNGDPRTRTSNGLMGPVVVRPYVDKVVAGAAPLTVAAAGTRQVHALQVPVPAAPVDAGQGDAAAIRLPAPPPGPVQEVWEGADGGGRRVRNVTRGTLTPVLPPPGRASGAAVIVVPGGGLMMLSIDNEGYDVARWLAERGVAAFVLKYRLVPTSADPKSFDREMAAKMVAIIVSSKTGASSGDNAELAPAVEDAQAALRYVKAHAGSFGVDPERVGMLGFSAGARITLAAAIADDVAGRPRFVGLMYGAMRAVAVPENAPPAFLAIANDDPLYGKNSGLVEAWRAAKRPVELHRYERGGHGFGMREHGTTSDHWKDEFLWWLQARGVLRPLPSAALSITNADHPEKK
ncbi:glycosyl hydrolase [Massilia luteola]|uniref:glycosyl hydrolase n=1 Tax=Massilia luteola TaxID=3081751 RepID=UPI002ACC2DA0|nr:glycosyl hydrolase [Massilia sp. Gc5]